MTVIASRRSGKPVPGSGAGRSPSQGPPRRCTASIAPKPERYPCPAGASSAIMSPMPELELTRIGDDRRRYEIDGVGALRLGGVLSRGATAEAGGAERSFARRGFSQQTGEVAGAAGDVVGSFRQGKLRRGGALRWGGRDRELRPASK